MSTGCWRRGRLLRSSTGFELLIIIFFLFGGERERTTFTFSFTVIFPYAFWERAEEGRV
jgi:hypothetical protein